MIYRKTTFTQFAIALQIILVITGAVCTLSADECTTVRQACNKTCNETIMFECDYCSKTVEKTLVGLSIAGPMLTLVAYWFNYRKVIKLFKKVENRAFDTRIQGRNDDQSRCHAQQQQQQETANTEMHMVQQTSTSSSTNTDV